MRRNLRFECLEQRTLLAATAWIGSSGNWDQAANWSNGLPTASAQVTINSSAAATITILSGESFSAATLSLASKTTLSLQLGGSPASNQYGTLAVSGTATLAGTLQAVLVNGYLPSTTDSFVPITFASASGSFSNFVLPSGAGYQFAGAVTFTNVVLSAAPSGAVATTVSAAATLYPAAANLLGVNTAYWDADAVTAQTEQLVQAAGLSLYRFPGGGAADEFHFNIADNLGDSAAITVAQFAQFLASVGGTGVMTVDYGSGSPQEAAAELAYLMGSPSDTTPLGTGIEWLPGANAWSDTNWGTVGYWASLRAAAPLAQNDGLNFLRIDHPTPFTSIKYWEIGNEVYGSWEIDHHGTSGPGGVSTGSAHDPATYAAFAEQFATLANEILTTAGLPGIAIGIDSGDPTGASDNSWTQRVLTAGLADGFLPSFISDHNYVQEPGNESDSYLLGETVTDPASVYDWSTRYADYQALLQQTLGSRAAGVQLIATEFNSVSYNPGKQTTSLVNGLFVAASLGGLLDSGYSGACFWDLRNDYDAGNNNSNALYGWREAGDYGVLGSTAQTTPPYTGQYIAYPDYYALQLASKIIAPGGQAVPVSSTYGDLDAYAVVEPDGDLCLLVINANPAAAIDDQIAVTGFQPSGTAQLWQYGKAQDTAQSQSPAGTSALAYTAHLALSLSGSNFSYAFPAYSMTVLDLARQVVTITANHAAKTYGAADPPFSVSYSGFVGSDNSGSLGGTLTFSTTEPGSGAAPVGTYQIIPAGLTSGKYTLAFVDGTLAVNQATPSLTVTDAGGVFDGSAYPATVTVTGISGLPASSLEGVSPTLTYYAGSTAGGTGSSTAPSAPGTYTVVGSFAGSGDYTAVSNSVTFAITNRSLAGSGDFNGDGTTDLLWQNQTTGLVQLSLVKNATITSWVTLAYADPSQWKLAGTGNFTGNGTTDVLWINTSSGEVGVWLINNATITGWATLAYVNLATWTFAGVGDFNHDGTSDVLWQSTTGTVGAWLIHNASIYAWAGLGYADPAQWKIIGLGDVTGDGTTDVLWQNTSSGVVGAWIVNNASVSSWKGLGIADPTAWKLVGVGDLNNDGTADLLWQNLSSPGTYGAWLVESSSITWASLPYAAPTQWQLLAVANVVGGATSNALVWENLSSGLLGAWGIQNGVATGWWQLGNV